jgi:hypothetical protein
VSFDLFKLTLGSGSASGCSSRDGTSLASRGSAASLLPARAACSSCRSGVAEGRNCESLTRSIAAGPCPPTQCSSGVLLTVETTVLRQSQLRLEL